MKMSRIKRNIKYDTIKIPSKLTKMIDTLIENNGYTSRTDVIKFAVRTLYLETNRNNKTLIDYIEP